eukprot:CAMPEP_0194494358 /NCGR_PEP_ID=MMETSP0253-20130528/12289_1 /TAXON_ID=2966 /ORGANISM="Noctiluca scintillans" /LENGTH=312 /DNA_ID=CAMNT_0039335461 /DNA_START=68 /DNA_END=1006 /DNA_ORIENTATION=-
MDCQRVLCEHFAVPICVFLDMPDLCSVEVAGFNRSVIRVCWRWLAEAARGWSRLGRLLAPESLETASDKVRMLALSTMHTAFVQISPHLSNHVLPAKPLHLHVQPGGQNPGEKGPQRGVTPHTDGGDPLPRFSRAWLSCPTLFGRGLAVGVELQVASKDVGQAVLLGVQCVPVRKDNSVHDVGMTLLFAPFSGQCLMWFEEQNQVVHAAALPPVSADAQRVEAWLSVTENGALSFCRRQQGSNKVESCGFQVRGAIVPNIWSSYMYKPCLCFSLPKLTARVEASVRWASDRLPLEVQQGEEEFDAVWCVGEP